MIFVPFMQLYNQLGIDVVLTDIVTWTNENVIKYYSTAKNILYTFNQHIGKEKVHNYDVALLLR